MADPAHLDLNSDRRITETVEIIDGRAFLDVNDLDQPVGIEILDSLSPTEVVSVISLLLDTLPR